MEYNAKHKFVRVLDKYEGYEVNSDGDQLTNKYKQINFINN